MTIEDSQAPWEEIPEQSFLLPSEIAGVADRHNVPLWEVIRRYIKLGLIAMETQQDENAVLVLVENGDEREFDILADEEWNNLPNGMSQHQRLIFPTDFVVGPLMELANTHRLTVEELLNRITNFGLHVTRLQDSGRGTVIFRQNTVDGYVEKEVGVL